MSEQAVTFLRTLASLTYGISLTEALTILDAATLINPVTFDWANASLDAQVAEARKYPEVTQHIGTTYESSKKISAIKELRLLSKMGLKESKDVIDKMVPARLDKARYCCYSNESQAHEYDCYTINGG